MEKKPRVKTEGYKASQKAYDKKRPPGVLVRFNQEELVKLDELRGDETRTAFIRRKALE